MILNARFSLLLVLLSVHGFSILPATASAQDSEAFQTWLEELRAEAVSEGYSTESIRLAFSEIREPVQRIVSNDRNQAEVVQTYADYLGKRVSEWKDNNGNRLMREHAELLNEIAEEFGVQPRFIVAIWGMETNFGTFPITEPVFSALATLAYDKRRAAMFRAQFFAALTILDSGFPPYEEMKSSWAGAMGQSQFMPDNYLRYAVDQDGDGRKDIWNTEADALGSIANYFASLGWRDDQTWGRKVLLPEGFEEEFANDRAARIAAPGQQCSRYRGLNNWRPLGDWQEAGIRREDGSDLPGRSIPAALILADAGDSEGYLVYSNFCTIMRFNPAFKYALSIGLLSDLLDQDR